MFIFEQDKYFNECHAISVIKLEDGEYLASWFAGSKEGNDDVDIWQSRTNNGKWDVPVKILSDELPLWNPVLLYETDKLTFFFRKGKGCSGWKSYYMTSIDCGRTYSKPVELPEGFLGPIKNKPIKMSNGKWLCGSSLEPEWETVMEVYDAGTETWLYKSVISTNTEGEQGIIQPTVWESTPGHVHGLMRSSLGKIYRSDSTDYGKTWSKPYATDMPNNNSGIDVVKLPGGELVLAYNPISGNWGKRSPLILSLSLDNGKTWPYNYTLQEEENIELDEENRYQGRYSYPVILEAPEGVICFYTYNRKKFKYQTVTLDEIKNA